MLVVAIAVATLVAGLFAYARWANRVQLLRWYAERQRELRAVGERLSSVAADDHEIRTWTIDDFVARGILGKSEVRFRDSWLNVTIIRSRPQAAPLSKGGRVAILVERYQPAHEYRNVLYDDGAVLLEKESTDAPG